MIAEIKSLIINLKENINKLKDLNSQTSLENNKLKEEIIELNNKIQQQDTNNIELINKYESLKLAKSIAVSSGDSHDAKIKINRLVREIDKCISLLNR